MPLQTLGLGSSLAIVVAPFVFALAGPAQATHSGLTACPGSFTTDGTAKVHDGTVNKETAADACQYATPADQNTIANQETINHMAFFGVGDGFSSSWEVWDDTLSQEAGGLSGTWSISDYDPAMYDYIIVFKDGAGTNLVAFHFNEEFPSGGWDSPFTEPPFDLPGGSIIHSVSHWTIARTEGEGDITLLPEPNTIALLGLGILGLAFGARRSAR